MEKAAVSKSQDEDNNQASIQPKLKKAKAITETKTSHEPEQLSEPTPEQASEMDTQDESFQTSPQPETQSKAHAGEAASTTERQTLVLTSSKPKVKAVRRVKTNTAKSTAEKAPVQPSDLDTDSTG